MGKKRVADCRPPRPESLRNAGFRVVEVSNVTVDVGKKDFVAILGPSGCGKTIATTATLIPTLISIRELLQKLISGQHSQGLNSEVRGRERSQGRSGKEEGWGWAFPLHLCFPALILTSLLSRYDYLPGPQVVTSIDFVPNCYLFEEFYRHGKGPPWGPVPFPVHTQD